MDAFDEALTEVEKDLNGKSAVDLMIHKAQQVGVYMETCSLERKKSNFLCGEQLFCA